MTIRRDSFVNDVIAALAGKNLVAQSLTLDQHLIRSGSGTLTSAGTTQATATQMTLAMNVFTSVAANSGARLQNITGQQTPIRNGTATALNIYPFTGAKINALAINAPFVLAANASVTMYQTSATQFWTFN